MFVIDDGATEHEFEYEIVNYRIRPIADRLVKKYEELEHINTSSILFLVNHKTSGGKKRIVLARTRCIPAKWQEAIYQLAGGRYTHCVEFIGKTTGDLDDNQMTALVYRELLLISPDGSIGTPDTNDWWHVIATLGRHWFYPDATCPDLLDDAVDWQKLRDKAI